MTNEFDAAAPSGAGRPRASWGVPLGLIVLAAMLSSAAQPALLLLLPLALLLIAAPPRRPALIAVGIGVLAFGLAGPAGDQLWWFNRGWALMLGAWFLLLTVLWPSASFINRAIASVLGAAVSAALLFLPTRSGWANLDASVAQKLRDGAAAAATQLGPALAARDWGAQALDAMNRAADLQAKLYPALLALASVAALAAAWWLWQRLTVRAARPLGALRELRFRDELVWLVVAAVLLIVLPLGQYATRAGTNLATFMAALYALRGLAVVLALFGMPGPMGVIFSFLAVLFLFPMVIAATLVLGLSDTWLDLRARARSALTPPGS